MEHFSNAVGHNKSSFMGVGVAVILGFIGKVTLSDAALIMAIISGAVTTLYTAWKWYGDLKKSKYSKSKHKKYENDL